MYCIAHTLVYYYFIETKHTNKERHKMNTMNITLEAKNGIQAVFTIEFKKSDFMNVVNMIDTVTIDTVENQELFKVI